MFWNIEFAEDGAFIRVTMAGPFTLAAQRQMLDELGRVAADRLPLPILFDNRRLVLDDSNLQMLQDAAAAMQNFMTAQKVRRLASIVSEGINFGIGRQFELVVEASGGHGFRLFKDEQLAISWLKGEINS